MLPIQENSEKMTVEKLQATRNKMFDAYNKALFVGNGELANLCLDQIREIEMEISKLKSPEVPRG